MKPIPEGYHAVTPCPKTLMAAGGCVLPADMANILGDDTKQQVLALGRLGWPLRRIEVATGVRRETASAYLKAAGVSIRSPRRRRLPGW
ncbi:MAG: hypothetical protein HYV62_01105 [Candidatus Rokubacteria bacterium]|nr:hypothetical protein [Candidatus Rokubacteria bacterium]